MVFRFFSVFQSFCRLPHFDISIRSGRKSRLFVPTSTSKSPKISKGGQISHTFVFFRIFAIRWAVGKNKCMGNLPTFSAFLFFEVEVATNNRDFRPERMEISKCGKMKKKCARSWRIRKTIVYCCTLPVGGVRNVSKSNATLTRKKDKFAKFFKLFFLHILIAFCVLHM